MFKESVEDFKNAMGVMTDLGNEALAERHWRRIFDKLEQPYFPGQAFKMEANPNPNPSPSPSPSPSPHPNPNPTPHPAAGGRAGRERAARAATQGLHVRADHAAA